jgi:hypothetical protein
LIVTMEYQNVPDSVNISHLSLAPMILFELGNKLLLFVHHYQTPCRMFQNSDSLVEIEIE